MTEPALPVSAALARRLEGAPLLLLLDVDGTLAPIAPTPIDAAVPPETRRVLHDLVGEASVQVAIVSGRSVDDARRMVGVSGIWVIGNHGFEMASPDAAALPHPGVASFELPLADAAAEIESLVRSRRGAFVENKRWTLSVHYRLADAAAGPEITSEVARVAAQHGLRVTQGRKVLEVRPPLNVDKGVSSVELARAVDALCEGASVLYAGDDRTDEDAFVALREAKPDSVTIHVETERTADSAATAAEFALPDVVAMRELLEWVRRSRVTRDRGK
jgi:trehalose-phosphatase